MFLVQLDFVLVAMKMKISSIMIYITLRRIEHKETKNAGC